MKPVKIAILSCIHGHAPGYFSLANDPHYELVAISVVPDSYRICHETGYGTMPDVPVYHSDEELYASHPDLEAVVVGSENKNHFAQTVEALKRGLHVFSMKVPTLNMDEYDKMMELAKETGRVVQVELELRGFPAIYRVRDLIADGAIGELETINIVNYSHNPVWWCPWQCDPELSYGEKLPLRPGDDRCRGGALTDHAHPFDLVRLMTGSDFDTVYANVTPNIREGVQTEDMIHLIGKMKNGVVFTIDPSYANDEEHVDELVNTYHWRIYPSVVEVFMTAVGSKGVIISNLYGKNSYVQVGEDRKYHTVLGGNEYAGIRSAARNEFYHCIREGREPSANLAFHKNSMETVVAAYDSVYYGRPVKVGKRKGE